MEKGRIWKIRARTEREKNNTRWQEGDMEDHVSKNYSYFHKMIDCMAYTDHDKSPGASPCVIKCPSHSRGSICSRGLSLFVHDSTSIQSVYKKAGTCVFDIWFLFNWIEFNIISFSEENFQSNQHLSPRKCVSLLFEYVIGVAITANTSRPSWGFCSHILLHAFLLIIGFVWILIHSRIKRSTIIKTLHNMFPYKKDNQLNGPAQHPSELCRFSINGSRIRYKLIKIWYRKSLYTK